MIDPARLRAALPPAAGPYAGELLRQMADVGIDCSPLRAAGFLGQIHAESAGFTVVEESLNYSTHALLRQFGRHRISAADAEKFGRNAHHPAHQNALANILYGGAWGRDNLGNTQPGDGWRFRGRGLKQLTGRSNYSRFSYSWLGTDAVEKDPDRLLRPVGAVASAVWFWRDKGLSRIADTGNVLALSRAVNLGRADHPGTPNGLATRRLWTAHYLQALSG